MPPREARSAWEQGVSGASSMPFGVRGDEEGVGAGRSGVCGCEVGVSVVEFDDLEVGDAAGTEFDTVVWLASR